MSPNKKLPKIIFGSQTIGRTDTLGSRIHDIDQASKLLDIFQAHGLHEVDSARLYGFGSTEEMLAEMGWQNRKIVLATKLYPTSVAPQVLPGEYTFSPDDLRRGLTDSLKALQADSIDTFYLHSPDRSVPLEDTLRGVNDLYKQGFIKRFGISNYPAWEVALMCEICNKNGWVKPAVYQGVYNVLQRFVEPELFPCLRHYGIAFYVYSPLAGGLLSGRYKRDQTEVEAGSRYDPKTLSGATFRSRYWNDAHFEAISTIESAASKHGLTLAETAIRWLVHHSQLTASLGDGIIVGASSTEHLERNLADLYKDSLPDDVVDAMESAWARAKAAAPNYFR